MQTDLIGWIGRSKSQKFVNKSVQIYASKQLQNPQSFSISLSISLCPEQWVSTTSSIQKREDEKVIKKKKKPSAIPGKKSSSSNHHKRKDSPPPYPSSL
jgi:hypothetical protein